MKATGFTLIELLIVVAILGILAAIAVPNVNDALIRAKVARMKNDTRVLGMAIENYVVDQGWYPYGQNCDPTDYLCSVCGSPESVEKTQIPHLFMPVSYAHSAPIDVFHKLYNSRTEKLEIYSITYAHLFQQLEKRNNCLATFAPSSTSKPSWTWSVYSVGPDGKESQFYDLAYWMQMPYDPSNGIRSMGDIQWSTQPPPVWDGGPRPM